MSKVAILCLVVPALLAGCATEQGQATPGPTPTTQVAQTTSSEARLEPGLNHISRKINDNTAIDADVNVPAEAAIPAVDVSCTSLDVAKVEAALFNNEATTSEQINPGQWLIENRGGTRACEIVSGSPHTINTYLGLRAQGVDSILDVLNLVSSDDLGNLTRFSNKAALGFASRDDAAKAVLSAVKGLGIEGVAVAEIYALDHQELKVVADQMKASGQYNEYTFKADWSPEDDCYFIRMACIVNNQTVDARDGTSMTEGEEISGSSVTAIYSSGGLQYLQVFNGYAIDGIGKPAAIISAERAIAAVGAKFNELITATKYTISDVTLKYVAAFRDDSQTALRLVPAWCVTVLETGNAEKSGQKSSIRNTLHVRLDAYTGKEM